MLKICSPKNRRNVRDEKMKQYIDPDTYSRAERPISFGL